LSAPPDQPPAVSLREATHAAGGVKCCPTCHRLYGEADAGFCPIDGAALKPTDTAPVPTDPDDRRIGSKQCGGRYQIWRKVADGGMGRVYQALDTREQRNVAMKVLHPEVASDEVAVERFKREYALSAELPHDHIVEVLAFENTDDDSYALVMEYLEGEELREFLKREKVMPAARVLRILSQLAIGLAEPHQRKLVHRDIKPDNVFLCHTPDGPVVKLLDFGSVRDNAEGAKKLTVIGTTIGSPYYMSPEQAQGLADLDHRADVWSLAAIAYECLTGKVPFGGKTGPQILLAILAHEPEPPSVAGSAQQVPPSLDDIMEDALAKDPSTRIRSVGELADRFGRAYGLEGGHAEWAVMPEGQLQALIDAKLPEVMARPRAAPQRMSDAFREEELAMGVPKGPPTGLYIGIGVGLAVVVCGVLMAFILL
jgi:serine/threonine-protein kinase